MPPKDIVMGLGNPWQTYTHGGIPDRQIIEDYARAIERARKQGAREAIKKLRQLMVDAEIAKLLQQMDKRRP